MEHEIRETSVLEFIDREGPRRLRKLSKDIAPDDDRRAEGLQLVLKELEAVGVLYLADRAREMDKVSVRVQARQERATAEIEQAHKVWNRGDTSPAGLIRCFDRVHPAAHFELLDRNGIPVQVPTAEDAITKSKQRGITVGLRPSAGHIIIGVTAKAAKEFGKRYDMPHTLQWEAGGWVNWLLRGSGTGASVIGEKARVVIGGRAFGSVRSASCDRAKWHVKPDNALAKGESELPRMPAKLARLIQGARSGAVLDEVLIG